MHGMIRGTPSPAVCVWGGGGGGGTPLCGVTRRAKIWGILLPPILPDFWAPY